MPGADTILRRLARALFLVAFSLLLLELLLFLGLRVATGHWVGYGDFDSARRAVLEGDVAWVQELPAVVQARRLRRRGAEMVLHPFLGFVLGPLNAPPGHPQAAELGVPRNQHPVLHEASPERVVVGVFGGSAAEIFADVGARRLTRALARVPRFAGREIVVVSVATGGYKQPQQLMALNYLLSLGGHFDVVINIDGFNEVGLPGSDLLPHGIAPFYPRDWLNRTAGIRPGLLSARGEIEYLHQVRQERARFFSRPVLRRSFLAAVLWRLQDRDLERRLGQARGKLGERARIREDFQTRGPRLSEDPGDPARLARHWARSSELMHGLCSALGIEYYHFLQPNQYVEGSKPMNDRERKIALTDDHPYGSGALTGYPELRREAAAAAERGLPVYDLTMLFAEVEEPLYIDNCCHFNAEGNRLMADAIATAIAAAPGVAGS